MNPKNLEVFLARLYTEDVLLERFEADPRQTALGEGADEDTAGLLSAADLPGIKMAAASFGRKRARKEFAGSESRSGALGLIDRLKMLFRVNVGPGGMK